MEIYLSNEDVLRILPDRDPFAHKGCFGRILLICGSRGYTGAAALCAIGALRSGAGLVYLAVPESIYDIEAVKLIEPIIVALPDLEGKLSESAIPEIRALLPSMDAVLIGPGLGRSEGVRRVVLSVLRDYAGPVVLDADGINMISAHKDLLRERTGVTILTPHDGEFQRLGGSLLGNRKENAVRFAAQYGVILLLKGHDTLITDGETTYINRTGNPGMAVGGSGDLLSGIITSFWGQKIRPIEAAACGAWVHGKAGDICAAQIGQYGMLPSDMAAVLPRLLK